MPLDVIGERIECAFNSRTVTFIGGGNAEPRKIGGSKHIRSEQAVQIATLDASVSGDRALRCAVDESKGSYAVGSLGAAHLEVRA